MSADMMTDVKLDKGERGINVGNMKMRLIEQLSSIFLQ